MTCTSQSILQVSKTEAQLLPRVTQVISGRDYLHTQLLLVQFQHVLHNSPPGTFSHERESTGTFLESLSHIQQQSTQFDLKWQNINETFKLNISQENTKFSLRQLNEHNCLVLHLSKCSESAWNFFTAYYQMSNNSTIQVHQGISPLT